MGLALIPKMILGLALIPWLVLAVFGKVKKNYSYPGPKTMCKGTAEASLMFSSGFPYVTATLSDVIGELRNYYKK